MAQKARSLWVTNYNKAYIFVLLIPIHDQPDINDTRNTAAQAPVADRSRLPENQDMITAATRATIPAIGLVVI